MGRRFDDTLHVDLHRRRQLVNVMLGLVPPIVGFKHDAKLVPSFYVCMNSAYLNCECLQIAPDACVSFAKWDVIP